MRVGDVYKINRMIEDGCTVEGIHARFKNDYTTKEIKKFIPKGTITDAEVEERDNANAEAKEAEEKAAQIKKDEKAKAKKSAKIKKDEKAKAKKSAKKDPLS